MTPTPDDAMPSELERMICNYTKNDRNAINRFLGAAQLCGYHLNRADKPHADDARKAHEWLESHVAMPHDIKTIVYSALSAASKEQSRGDE